MVVLTQGVFWDFLAGGSVQARRVSAPLDLELFAGQALVLLRALAGEAARLGRLRARPAVEARLRLTLVEIDVAQLSRPADFAVTAVFVDAIHAHTVDAPVVQALVDVGEAHRVRETGRAVALEFLQTHISPCLFVSRRKWCI